MPVSKLIRPGLTTTEVAKLLGVTERKVIALVKAGLLDAMELHPRFWFYTHDAVERCRVALSEEK